MDREDLEMENGLRSLTPKEALFLKLYFDTGNVAQSVIDAKLFKPKKRVKPSSNKITAASIGSRLLREIKPQIEEMLDAAGLSKIEILKSLKDGLQSDEAIRVREKGEDGKEITVVRQYPDFKARAKYVEMALKVHQMLVNMPTFINQNVNRVDNRTAIVHQHRESLEGKSVDELRAILEEENRTRTSVRAIGTGTKR